MSEFHNKSNLSCFNNRQSNLQKWQATETEYNVKMLHYFHTWQIIPWRLQNIFHLHSNWKWAKAVFQHGKADFHASQAPFIEL